MSIKEKESVQDYYADESSLKIEDNNEYGNADAYIAEEFKPDETEKYGDNQDYIADISASNNVNKNESNVDYMADIDLEESFSEYTGDLNNKQSLDATNHNLDPDSQKDHTSTMSEDYGLDGNLEKAPEDLPKYNYEQLDENLNTSPIDPEQLEAIIPNEDTNSTQMNIETSFDDMNTSEHSDQNEGIHMQTNPEPIVENQITQEIRHEMPKAANNIDSGMSNPSIEKVNLKIDEILSYVKLLKEENQDLETQNQNLKKQLTQAKNKDDDLEKLRAKLKAKDEELSSIFNKINNLKI